MKERLFLAFSSFDFVRLPMELRIADSRVEGESAKRGQGQLTIAWTEPQHSTSNLNLVVLKDI